MPIHRDNKVHALPTVVESEKHDGPEAMQLNAMEMGRPSSYSNNRKKKEEEATQVPRSTTTSRRAANRTSSSMKLEDVVAGEEDEGCGRKDAVDKYKRQDGGKSWTETDGKNRRLDQERAATPGSKEGPPSEEQPDKMSSSPCCSLKKCHVLVFICLALLEFFDLVGDWLFYTDVRIATEGLVYGPVDSDLVHAILAFSIIGTVAFLVEMINLYYEVIKGKEVLDSDMLSAVIVWFEDVPQIILSLLIALCRKDAISVFQLTKAGFTLFLFFVRIIIVSVKYCNPKAVKARHHVKVKVVIFLGLFLEAGCAGAIFFLTNTEPNESGQASFRVPSSLFLDEYNDQRYFAGTSVFLNQRGLFDPENHSGANDAINKVNWMRVVSIDDIRSKGQVHFKYDYQITSPESFNMAVWQNKTHLSECYTINHGTNTVVEQTATMCASPGFINSKASTSVYLTFKYTASNALFKRRVLGHIAFNGKIKSGNYCRNLVTNEIADSIAKGRKQTSSLLTLHFYRTGSDSKISSQADDDGHMRRRSAGSPTFYHNDGTGLLDVQDVWKTGWKECPMTGYVGPPLDSGIEVACW